MIDSSTIIVARDCSKIIGANCFMSAEYLVQGISCKVMQSCDSMVHPNY